MRRPFLCNEISCLGHIASKFYASSSNSYFYLINNQYLRHGIGLASGSDQQKINKKPRAYQATKIITGYKNEQFLSSGELRMAIRRSNGNQAATSNLSFMACDATKALTVFSGVS